MQTDDVERHPSASLSPDVLEEIMSNSRQRNIVLLAAIATIFAYLPFVSATRDKSKVSVAQNTKADANKHGLEFKLRQKAEFIPSDRPPLQQLTEVAQHYRLPMGIEWLEQTKDSPIPPLSLGSEATVQDLIGAIVARAPIHFMVVEKEIIHISPASTSDDPQNVLDIRVEEFEVDKKNLFDVEEKLWWAVEIALHPEEFKDGYMGGYGFAPDDIFAIPNITFSGDNLTVREILDRIAKANGNALWVAQVKDLTPKGETMEKATDVVEEEKKLYWKFVRFN